MIVGIEEETFLTLEEVSEITGFTKKVIVRWIKRGVLQRCWAPYKGGPYRIPLSSLEELVHRQPWKR